MPARTLELTSCFPYGLYFYTFGSKVRLFKQGLTIVSVFSLSLSAFLLVCFTVPRPFLFSCQFSTEGMNLLELLGSGHILPFLRCLCFVEIDLPRVYQGVQVQGVIFGRKNISAEGINIFVAKVPLLENIRLLLIFIHKSFLLLVKKLGSLVSVHNTFRWNLGILSVIFLCRVVEIGIYRVNYPLLCNFSSLLVIRRSWKNTFFLFIR